MKWAPPAQSISLKVINRKQHSMKEIICEKCSEGNYWTEHHFVDGELVGLCKHKMSILGVKSIGEKLQELNDKRQPQ